MTTLEFDALWTNRHLEASAAACRVFLENQLAMAPDFDWWWRGARAEHFFGEQALDTGDSPVAIQHFEHAIELAAKADEVRREQLEPNFWRGVATLDAGLLKGPVAAARAYGPAERWLGKAEYFDEHYLGAGPAREIGRIYRKRPLILGGNLDKAIAFFKYAHELAPGHSTNLLYLADVYIVDRQPRAARESLKALLDLDEPDDGLWELERDQRTAKKWLVERFD